MSPQGAQAPDTKAPDAKVPAADAVARGDTLVLEGVTKRFGTFTALSDVSVAFRSGEVHCILGENGAGKSTLCNILFGIHRPDEGALTLDGAPYVPNSSREAIRAGIAMVHQHFSLIEDLSVVDNLILGQERGIARRDAYAAKIEGLTQRYGLALAPRARVGDLSIGERQRVEIVKALVREPRILILDEPTAVLLPDEIKSLLDVVRRVAADGCAVLLVTHKLAEIRNVADRISVLRQGQIVAGSDDPGRDIDALVRAMIRRPVDQLDPTMMATLGMSAADVTTPVEKPPPKKAHGPDALTVDGLGVTDRSGVVRLDNFTVTVKHGEIVGIAGVEGNGQSELGAVLAGLLAPTSGRVFIDDKELTGRAPEEFTAAGMGIVPEDRHLVGAINGMSLMDNLFLDRSRVPTRFGLVQRAAMRTTTEALMRTFDVRAASPGVAFGSLSGGNQQKAVLARELTAPNLKVLLAAQPTRGLDVGAVEAVYGLIKAACERGIAVLLVSSELDEILAVADRVLVLYRGRVVGECPGDPGQRDRIGRLMAGQAA